jgi:hypothetical protein
MTEPDIKGTYYKKILNVSNMDELVLDPYLLFRVFNVTDPSIQHAIKKLLMPGERGGKDWEQDMLESISAIERGISVHFTMKHLTEEPTSNLERALNNTVDMHFPDG